MKKNVLLISFVLTLFNSLLAQQAYKRPESENKESWSMIMIPDIQTYVKWSRNKPILDIMLR